MQAVDKEYLYKKEYLFFYCINYALQHGSVLQYEMFQRQIFSFESFDRLESHFFFQKESRNYINRL